LLRGRELQQLDEQLMNTETIAENKDYWLKQKKK